MQPDDLQSTQSDALCEKIVSSQQYGIDRYCCGITTVEILIRKIPIDLLFYSWKQLLVTGAQTFLYP